jgi:hypothetical protein
VATSSPTWMAWIIVPSPQRLVRWIVFCISRS